MREIEVGDRVLIKCMAHRYQVTKILGDTFWAIREPCPPDTAQVEGHRIFAINQIIYHYTPEDLI